MSGGEHKEEIPYFKSNVSDDDGWCGTLTMMQDLRFSKWFLYRVLSSGRIWCNTVNREGRGDIFLQNVGDFRRIKWHYIPEDRTLNEHNCFPGHCPPCWISSYMTFWKLDLFLASDIESKAHLGLLVFLIRGQRSKFQAQYMLLMSEIISMN